LDEYPQLNDDHIAAYEEALDFLLAGDWEQSFKLLHQVPADDEVKDFLTVLIAQHNRKCPADWEGVIPLLSK
jgi:adenylate cyclase